MPLHDTDARRLVALQLGEQIDLGRLAIKAAMLDVDRLGIELQKQGVSDQTTGTYAYLSNALQSYEDASKQISHELAAKLEETLP